MDASATAINTFRVEFSRDVQEYFADGIQSVLTTYMLLCLRSVFTVDTTMSRSTNLAFLLPPFNALPSSASQVTKLEQLRQFIVEPASTVATLDTPFPWIISSILLNLRQFNGDRAARSRGEGVGRNFGVALSRSGKDKTPETQGNVPTALRMSICAAYSNVGTFRIPERC